MSLKIAIQVDDPAEFNPATDSTMQLGLAAQKRGHLLYYYLPEQLYYTQGAVWAKARAITFFDDETHWYECGEDEILRLAEMDVVLIRQNPPFDRSYISTTYLLERLPRSTLVVNNPAALRNWSEKISIIDFPDFIPPTLISRDVEVIEKFRQEHGEIIIKPLFGYGGHGVFHLDKESSNLFTLLELLTGHSREPLMIQQFLPQVREQEKRILLIDGKFAGAIGRLPPAGEIRANMRIGGQAIATDITKRERELCDILGEKLKADGILLAGLDTIAGQLIEINVTSPTGLRTLDKLTGADAGEMFWIGVEKSIG